MSREKSQGQAAARQDSQRHVLLATRAFVDEMQSRYRELEKQTGASITMHRALACIATQAGISASGLADALAMKRPAVSHVLKGLLERGWIERLRTEADHRTVQLRLSMTGALTMKATGGAVVGTLQRAFGQLTDEEVAALSTGLTALLRELSIRTPSSDLQPGGQT